MRRGALSGFSIEFHSEVEHREAGVRVIEKAELTGLALCDQGAYPQSTAEIRRGGGGGRGARGGRLGSFRGRIPKNKRLDCRCSPGSCTKAVFRKGSFDRLTKQALDDDDDVLAVVDRYERAIGSRKRKSVRFWENAETGDLEFALDVPNNELGKSLMETFDEVDLFARPYIDTNASKVNIVGEVAEYTRQLHKFLFEHAFAT